MNPVKHVAIIMDGNGRWGIKHKQSRNAGHKAGLNTVDLIINHCIKHKIKFLTLYTFSSENWKRPKNEITFLFKLLENFLKKKINKIIEKDIKLKFAGHRAGLYTVESVIDECLKINIKYLTLYTFSTENWKRPKKEINYLFNLLENFLTNKIDNLLKKQY